MRKWIKFLFSLFDRGDSMAVLDKRVVIDIGHGGQDPGAVSDSVTEKQVVLDIGHKIEPYFFDSDISLIYTRRVDEFISLSDRVNKAVSSSANIFISLHVNAFSEPSANGLETYHFPGSGQGVDLARSVQSHLINNTDFRNRGTKSAKFFVLRKTPMPAILIEYGFITNPDDREKLISPDYQDRLAKLTSEGIKHYFKEA